MSRFIDSQINHNDLCWSYDAELFDTLHAIFSLISSRTVKNNFDMCQNFDL